MTAPTRTLSRKILPFCLPLLLAGLLAGCGSDNHASAEPLDASDNVLHARFSGDINRSVTFRGDEVGIGYIPSSHGAFFSIGGTQAKDGQVTSVTLGPLVGIELKPGPARREDSLLHGGLVEYGSEYEPDQYASSVFDFFYDTSGDGTDGESTLVFSKVEQEPSSNAMLVRYHLVGQFTVHTAHKPDPMSQACQQDAIEAAIAGGRLPRYNAELCGAKRADVDADFDVRVELANLSSIKGVSKQP